MPRATETYRVSLNHIRDKLGNPVLRKKRGLDLIYAFLPAWSETSFLGDADSCQTSINFFCGGNRKQGRLANIVELNTIVDKLCQDESYVDEVLSLAQQWITGSPAVKNSNPVFTSMELISKTSPTETEREQFSQISTTIDALRKINTTESLTYALFLLVLIGVLQERILEVYHSDYISLRRKQALGENPDMAGTLVLSGEEIKKQWVPPMKGYEFVADSIQHYSETEIQEIDMAFHGGETWLRDEERVELIKEIVNKNIHLRVLVNTEDALKRIYTHMQQTFRIYMGFDRAISVWKKWEDAFQPMMEVRVSKIPLLHRVYLIRKKDGTGIANVSCYTYGTYSPGNFPRLFFGEGTAEYGSFEREFDYLWEQAGADSQPSGD